MNLKVYLENSPKEGEDKPTRLSRRSFDLELRLKSDRSNLSDDELKELSKDELLKAIEQKYRDSGCKIVYVSPDYEVFWRPGVINPEIAYAVRVKGYVELVIEGRVNQPIPEAHIGEKLQQPKPSIQ